MFTTIEGLPEFLRKILPISAQEYFLEVFKLAVKGYDEETAFMYAWEATKLKMQKTEGGYIININNSTVNITPEAEEEEDEEDTEVFSLPMDKAETSIVMNSKTEEIIMNAVLADMSTNTEGKRFTELELNQLSDQINLYGSTLPDVDHEKLIELCKTYGNNPELIGKELRKEKGVFTSIKSAVKEGRLWIQAVLDKRYKNHIERFKNLSIEVAGNTDSEGIIRNPSYWGFTFTNTPQLPGAQIVSVA